MTGALSAEETAAGEESGKGFFEALKTGRRLCALVNSIRPGIVPRVNKMAVPAMQMENIGMFLTAAETLGLKPNEVIPHIIWPYSLSFVRCVRN